MWILWEVAHLQDVFYEQRKWIVGFIPANSCRLWAFYDGTKANRETEVDLLVNKSDHLKRILGLITSYYGNRAHRSYICAAMRTSALISSTCILLPGAPRMRIFAATSEAREQLCKAALKGAVVIISFATFDIFMFPDI